MRHNGAFFKGTFQSKIAFFYYSQVGKWRQIGYAINPSYFSDIGLGALVLVAHNGVVGGTLEGGEVVEVKDKIDQFFSLFSADCYENYAFLRRHLAPKKVAPNLNALMDWHQKLIDCNTMSDGYFDTLLAFLDAFFRKILDLEGLRPKTKGHTVDHAWEFETHRSNTCARPLP